MSNIMYTSFNQTAFFRQYGIAISPSNASTFPTILGTPVHYDVYNSSLTFSGSYTQLTGSNSVLFVIEWHLDVYGGISATATFGATPMNIYYQGVDANYNYYTIFYLVNPSVTTANVTITYSSNPGTMFKMIGAFSTKDTNQTTPINANASQPGQDTSTTINIPNQINYSLLWSNVETYVNGGYHTVMTIDGSQSSMWNFDLGTGTSSMVASYKNADIALLISVSDSLTSTENLSLNNALLQSLVVETLTCVENLTPKLNISVPLLVDLLSITEYINVTPPHYPFSPFESDILSITESITLSLPINLSLSETLSITENFTVPDPSLLNVGLIFDSLTFSETLSFDTFRFMLGRSQIGRLGRSL